VDGIRRALLSVSDKRGLVVFASRLVARGIELVSTGGTARVLREAGLPVVAVSELTGFPEMMDGRVKTLHPAVHGGILARRDRAEDLSALREMGYGPIDLVVVNLYPFEATIAREGVTRAEAVEQIDIGGPSMVRSAAKNHAHVAVVTTPADYPEVAESIEAHDGVVPESLRLRLAADAFLHTAAYDSAIAAYMAREVEGQPEAIPGMPPVWGMPLVRREVLRYGENPHQPAGLYVEAGEAQGVTRSLQLQGKPLSYNNWMDMDAAYGVARDLGPTGLVIVKHANPCGAARSDVSLLDAYAKARACDPVSAFGGIVATAGVIDEQLAMTLADSFLEVIIASEVTSQARAVLSRKKRLRVLTLDDKGWCADKAHSALQPRPIAGGLLLQVIDSLNDEVSGARVVTQRQPTEQEWAAMTFGWAVCRHVKSNAIVFSFADRTAAIGAGQMSRVDSSNLAVMKATESLTGSALASDAFFPFADGVEAAAEAGATAVVQPGGSIRDEEVIAAADACNLAMVFTGRRHFRH
jgi:phosphoribosylaminoimidazolecarboxamide formyltransferase/IMP cyclohydrolase